MRDNALAVTYLYVCVSVCPITHRRMIGDRIQPLPKYQHHTYSNVVSNGRPSNYNNPTVSYPEIFPMVRSVRNTGEPSEPKRSERQLYALMTKDRFTISSNSSTQQAPPKPHAPLSASATALNTASTASTGSATTLTVGTIKLTSGGIATITNNASIPASGPSSATTGLVASTGPQGSTTSLTIAGQYPKCPSPGSTIGTVTMGTTRSVSSTLSASNNGVHLSGSTFSTSLSNRITAQVPPPTTLPIGSMAARSPTFGASAHR